MTVLIVTGILTEPNKLRTLGLTSKHFIFYSFCLIYIESPNQNCCLHLSMWPVGQNGPIWGLNPACLMYFENKICMLPLNQNYFDNPTLKYWSTLLVSYHPPVVPHLSHNWKKIMSVSAPHIVCHKRHYLVCSFFGAQSQDLLPVKRAWKPLHHRTIRPTSNCRLPLNLIVVL